MTRPLPSDRPTVAELVIKLRCQLLPSPPSDWVEWLSRTKQISPSTVKLYAHHISQFLGFAELIFPSRPPSILFAWNLQFCQEFLEVIKDIVNTSTFQNYHSSLTSVRRFLAKQNKRPENYADINDEFSEMRVAGQRKKAKYLRKQKAVLLNANTNLLRRFYCDVIHNKFFWRLFDSMVEQSQRAIESKKRVPKFSKGHLFFANAFIIALMQSSNFKRSGNYAEIKCAEARKKLEKAVVKFETKFPEREFCPEERRLDRRYCVPAVLMAKDGRKKDEVEWFVILNPRDVLAVFLYVDFIRPYGPRPPKTDSLFVNSQGESLGYNVSR